MYLGGSSIVVTRDTCLSVSVVGLQDLSQSDAGFNPEVGSVQHLLPERHLLAHSIHPGCRAASVLAGAQVETDPTEEVLLAHPVVVPDSHLQASVGQVLDTEVVPSHGLIPPRTGRLPADSSLLFALLMVGQQVAEMMTILAKILMMASLLGLCDAGTQSNFLLNFLPCAIRIRQCGPAGNRKILCLCNLHHQSSFSFLAEL